jgi:hypothetical protein
LINGGNGRKSRFDSTLTIPAEIHDAIMLLTPDSDRELVNQVVSEGMGPRRPAGSPDEYGVPIARRHERLG